MQLTGLISAAILAGTAVAQDVACLVNGSPVAQVDLETGSCPFTIPQSYPVNFEYVSSEEYDVTFYYAFAGETKFFNDIENAGRIIDIPANLLYGGSGTLLFQVDIEETPAANSTSAIRRRLLKQVETVKRDEVDDFIASIKELEGTSVEITLEVVDPVSASSDGAAGSGAPTSAPESTVTNTETSMITITSCSNDACGTTEVPATPTLTTVTEDEQVTSYTTYCPVTTVVTVTSCSDDVCATSEVPATPSMTTVTKDEEVTSYYTYCPLTEEGEATTTEVYTTTLTTTSCDGDVCETATYPATEGETTTTLEGGETTIYTTWCPATEEGTSTLTVEVTTTAGEGGKGGEGEEATTTATTPAEGEEATTTATTPAEGEATTEATTPAEGEATTAATTAATPTTVAASASGSLTVAPISTYAGAANKFQNSFLLAIVPLVGFFM